MHAHVAPTNWRVSCSLKIQPQIIIFASAGNYLEIRESKLEICIARFQRVVSDKILHCQFHLMLVGCTMCVKLASKKVSYF